jgi:hypothetical protein
MVLHTTETLQCPECGGDRMRSTARTAAGRHHVCDACNHVWHEPERRSTSKSSRRALPRWTREQAIARFMQHYPDGFHDASYDRQERDWKWAKHELWRNETAPDGIGALAKRSPDAAKKLIEKMLQTRAPMLHPMSEIVAMRDAVHRPEHTGAFFSALHDLLEAPVLTAAPFEAYVDQLTSLPLIGSGNLNKWTIVTYIPFLAQPSRHMFLKPGRTREITRRLGVDILYSATVKWDTYERLLAFSGDLLEQLKPLGARDMIDVQSFIWAVTRDDG